MKKASAGQNRMALFRSEYLLPFSEAGVCFEGALPDFT